MRISTGNFDSIFFLGFTPFLNLETWRKWKILLKQLVSTTPLKPLNRIAWNFVVMKDIMCRYAFLQEMLIWSNAWNCHSCHSLYTAFSSNVGAWGMWACSLFLSLKNQKLMNVVVYFRWYVKFSCGHFVEFYIVRKSYGLAYCVNIAFSFQICLTYGDRILNTTQSSLHMLLSHWTISCTIYRT